MMRMVDVACETCGAMREVLVRQVEAPEYPSCCGRTMVRRYAAAAAHVVADDIPGGVEIAHGLCHADGRPRRFDSRSAIARACREKGLVPYHDVYQESGETRIKDARVHDDWLRSREAQQARRERVDARRLKGLER
jgi:hypothetical protein